MKIGLFEIGQAGLNKIARGTIDFRRVPLSLHLSRGPSPLHIELASEPDENLTAIISETFASLAQYIDLGEVVAIGHRIVHGGDRFDGPVLVDSDTLAEIENLTALAPLHQPQSLRLIHAVRNARPELPQIASFDTAFHRTNDAIVRRFALPRHLHDQGIKRYGFHGLSYKYIAAEFLRLAPEKAKGKVVAAHLGSGASLCALEGGVSRDTSMSFTTLDGIPMATRCGAIDPGVLLHLLGPKKCSFAEVEDILYHRSGLLGVSGISADSRELLDSSASEAREAIDLFTFRIAGEIARLSATLGGLDAIIFTAGVGEHQPPIRQKVCERLSWLGIELDLTANASNARLITGPQSPIAGFVIPTDEEQILAEEALSLCNGAA